MKQNNLTFQNVNDFGHFLDRRSL